MVGGSHDHTVLIFNRKATGWPTRSMSAWAKDRSIRSASPHHPGYECEIFAACYSSRIVRVSPQGEIRKKIEVHEGAVKSLRLHPHETMGVSCGADGLLLSWSFEGELLRRYLGHTAIINDVDLDPSGQRLASVSRDFTLKVFEVATRTARALHSDRPQIAQVGLFFE